MRVVSDLDRVFGTCLREARRQVGLTQEELALQCGIERTYISFLERGLRKPSVNALFVLCGALQMVPSKLIRQVETVLKDSGR